MHYQEVYQQFSIWSGGDPGILDSLMGLYPRYLYQGFLQDNPPIINNADELKNILLSLAIQRLYDDDPVIARLIQNGAQLNGVCANDPRGFSLLHLTAFYDMPKTAELLMAAGAEPNCVDLLGRTPLHVAASQENTCVVDALAKHPKIRLQLRNRAGEYPIDVAIDTSLEWLHGVFALKKLQLIMAIKDAERATGPQQLSILFEINKILRNICPQQLGSKEQAIILAGIHEATQRGQYKIVGILFHHLEDNFSIQVLTESAQKTMLKGLLYWHRNHANLLSISKKYTNANYKESLFTYMLFIKKLEQLGVLDKLADEDINDPSMQYQLLFYAALYGKIQLLARLRKSGVDLNHKFRHNNTTLHLAAIGGHVKTVNWLLEADVDYQVVNSTGQQAIQVATALKNEAVVAAIKTHPNVFYLNEDDNSIPSQPHSSWLTSIRTSLSRISFRRVSSERENFPAEEMQQLLPRASIGASIVATPRKEAAPLRVAATPVPLALPKVVTPSRLPIRPTVVNTKNREGSRLQPAAVVESPREDKPQKPKKEPQQLVAN